jgi:protein arginine kinase
MAFEELLTSKEDWFLKPGPSCEVVISSRVRLARNLEGKKFPHHANATEQREVVAEIQKAISSLPQINTLKFVHLNQTSSLDRQFLTEHQLISAEHAASLGERAVVFDVKEGMSFLVNEEDHLRLQVFRSGLNLKDAFHFLTALDMALSLQLRYATDPELGYLTACPTNLGVALRASVMLHLPALVYTNRAAQVLQGVTQVGLTVRGLQGETTQLASAFFQISNQSSLGKRGVEIVEHVDRVARQLAEVELQTQRVVFQQEGLKLADRICRALGTLKNAKIITLQEALDGLSALRVGVEQKILTGIDLPNLNSLLILIQPAHLAKIAARELNPEQEAMERARLLGMNLKSVETA